MKLQQQFVKSLLLSLLFSVSAATYAETENTLLPPELSKWQRFKNFVKPKYEKTLDIYEGVEYVVSDYCQGLLKTVDDASLRLCNGKFSLRNFVINNRVRIMLGLSVLLRSVAAISKSRQIGRIQGNATLKALSPDVVNLVGILKQARGGRTRAFLKEFIWNAAANVARLKTGFKLTPKPEGETL